jgi:hypothetical protein
VWPFFFAEEKSHSKDMSQMLHVEMTRWVWTAGLEYDGECVRLMQLAVVKGPLNINHTFLKTRVFSEHLNSRCCGTEISSDRIRTHLKVQM